MISIIICTYNREKYLYGALENIAKNTISKDKYEIVLVNNNSTDSTEELCNRFHTAFPDITFSYFVETNQGLSFARNRGIAEAKGDVLLFLDDDSFVQPDYLTNLQLHLDSMPNMMAFGGKIDPLFESGEAPKWLCKWTYSWVSAIDLGDNIIPFPETQYPIGANMGFRKECIERLGNFNTQLGRSKKNLMGGEEKDIFTRVHKAGLKIYYLPDILVRHVIPPSRTTQEYIARLGEGIGISERLRCINLGHGALTRRLLSELKKWAGTLVLDIYYLAIGRPIVSQMITVFRRNVTRGLLKTN